MRTPGRSARWGSAAIAAAVAVAVAVAACGGGRAPAAAVVAPTPAAVAAPAAVVAPPKVPSDAYLPAAEMGGGRDCLNPDSAAVREAFGGPKAADALVDARAVADDVPVFRGVLERVYSGYGELLQHPGFDADLFFRSWEDELRAGPPQVALRAAVLERVVALKTVLGDRHLKLRQMYPYFAAHPALQIGEVEAADAPVDLTLCRAQGGGGAVVLDGTLRRAPVIADDGTRRVGLVATVRGTGATVTLACGEQTIELARRPAAPRRGAPAYELTSDGDAAVIVVGRLWGASAELAKLPAEAERAARHKLIVVDLRGNGGGNDLYFHRWVQQLAAGRVPGPTVVRGASADRCAPWNVLIAAQVEQKTIDTPDARAARDELRGRIARSTGTRPMISSGMVELRAPAPYRGRVIVLVDRDSASSAETSARMISLALGGTVIGERSGGYFEYGELAPFVMPASRIAWDVPTKRFYTPEPIEGVGLPVDAYLAPAAARLDAIKLLPALRKLPPRDELRRAGISGS